LRGIDTTEGVCAVDPDENAVARVRRLFPDLECRRTREAVFRDTSVDAVVIATPTSTHHALVKEALVAGKHVLSEKPLYTNYKEGLELVELAETRGLVLMVGHVYLFNPSIARVRALLVEGELGSLHYVTAVRTNLGPVRRDVNAAFDLAAHDIAVLNWLVGASARTVSAVGGCYLQSGIHDVVFVSLRYDRLLANIHASWLEPRKVRQMTLVGTKRMLTWDEMQVSNPIAIYDKGASTQEYGSFGEFLRLSMWEGDVRLPRVPAYEPLQQQDEHFVDAIRTRSLNLSNGRGALEVVRTLDAIALSLAAGGTPVAIQ
jgi:predicted dehydrogenase